MSPVNAFLRLVRPLDFRRVDECRRVLQWLEAGPGDRILDVGCGDGYFDRKMALAGATVTGIDVRPARVELAKRRNPHPRVTYLHMEAEELRFPAAAFNKAVSICVLEHIRDDQLALQRICSALEPGGRLVLSCDSLSNRGISPALRRKHAVRYAVHRFYTRESLAALLERSGFTLTRAEFVLTTPVSLAITRGTYLLDDIGRLPLGFLVKFPGLALAGSLGAVASGIAERIAPRGGEGLTLIAEAIKREQ
jgi:ubiquinone/menaquinone biosynthesis C-methylase UbiE